MIACKSMLVAPLLVVGLLVGGDPAPQDKQKQKEKDPQSTYEPRSRPGAGQKFLEKFVGEWNVDKSFFPRTGGEPAKTKGTCVQKMVHEGRFLKSEFVFEQGATRSTGTGTIGFEADSGLFTSVWIDSRATRMSFRQSQERFDGKEIVLFGKSLQAEGPDARRSRTVTHMEDDGRKIIHRQYAIAADGTERLMMELVMSKK